MGAHAAEPRCLEDRYLADHRPPSVTSVTSVQTATVQKKPVTDGPLLPGEWTETNFRGDAEHWVRVYEELVSTVIELAAADGAPKAAYLATERRYRRRLEFWQLRLRELSSRY